MSAPVILDAEERHAWREYLALISDCPAHAYEDVEPWAWAKLAVKLAAIEARRKGLEATTC